DANKEYVGTTLTLLNPYALLGGATTLLLFLTHGAMYLALKTDGDIRHRARALAVKLGVATAVVAVVFLVWTQASTGDLASSAAFVLGALALLAGVYAAWAGREGWAFTGTFLAIALAVAGLFLALFPDVMPSTTDAAYSLTTTNASATAYTLKIMTWVAVLFTPLVLLYQGWTYWVFRKRISTHHIPAPAAAAAAVDAPR
ncbi:MAG: cytochrome d ubiquinol oxidase subunit II, partial [Nocardioides sp.]